jgi:hypothetical protein
MQLAGISCKHMNAHLRKLALMVHMVGSVGWIGSVAAFLVLALTGLNSPDPEKVRAAYLVMEPVTWSVIVPLAFVSLLTGVILSLGTKWGLFRHYWIIAKFLINLLSILLLLLHTQLIHEVAVAASGTVLSAAGLHGSRVHLVIAAVAALAALLLATMLSVFKPRGLTPYGVRKQTE